MFDGNHRSRRNVNLGSRRVRSRQDDNNNNNSNKTALLARTELLRKERHAAQLRERSAVQIQRLVRGWKCRQCFWKNLCHNNDKLMILPDSSLERHVVVLNYILAWKKDVAQQVAFLQQFALRLKEHSNIPTQVSNHLWIHRIVQTCLQLLAQSSPSTTTTMTTPPNDNNDNKSWLLSLWKACQTTLGIPLTSPRFLGEGVAGKIILAQAAVATNANDLFQALHQVMTTTNNDDGSACLYAAVGWALGRLEDEASLAQVVQVLTAEISPPSSSSFDSNRNAIIEAARRLAPIEQILPRALPRPTLLPLVLQLWRDDPALLAMTQWLAWGKNQTDFGGTSTNRNLGGAQKNSSGDSDSDDDYENDNAMDVDTPSTKTSKTTAMRRVSKPQTSTLTRLDRLARETQDKWRRAAWDAAATTSDKNKERHQTLATILSDTSLWFSWGHACLSSGNSMNNNNNNNALAAHYVAALAQLIPTSLYTRSTATSPVLNKLAFDAGILQGLWRQTQQMACSSPATTALTVWSNVFAQTLMVIKDDEFLASYAGSMTQISAAQVITLLRESLYRVYWTVPVQVNDVMTAFAGVPDRWDAHLLLAGTKLYNALYQRWCRLVRHKESFASEDIWWFPTLSTSTTRVQLDAPHANHHESDSDDDAMDISPVDAESEALAAAFDDPKLSRVLTSIPQALPFEKRVKLFDSLVKADKIKTQDESAIMQNALAAMMRGEEADNRGRQRVEIRREHLYHDAMHQLNSLGTKLRQKVQVSFINQHGAAEAGIDGGGVFKEFLDDLVRDAFSLEETTATLPLFKVTPLETLAVNLDYSNRRDLLSHYEFLGRAIGKAVYEGILVDPQFCLPFLNGLLNKSNSLEDLKNYDPEYYKNLTKLLSLKSSDFVGLGLTFEVSIGSLGRTVELVPGGSHEAVTPENVIRYAHLVAHQMLNVQAAAPVRAFLRGFRDLIPAPWVRLFAAHELQKIISGDDRGLDVTSFKATMQYAAGYHSSQPIVKWFWEIVEKDLTPDQQCKLLKFMTSCSRQPLLGFSSLEPAPCIQQIRLPDSLFLREPADILKQAPLPTSSTCMNLLKLPNYRSKELMRVKLIAAIESNAGFELT